MPLKCRPSFTAFLLTGALLWVSGCQRKPVPGGVEAGTGPVATVQVATVSQENVGSAIEVSGTILAVDRAVLAAKFMGAIEELPVRLGQSVHAGDVLVKISAADITARLAQARTLSLGARRDLERERSLLTKGVSTSETVRSFEDRLATAEAQEREAEALLSYAVIRAPFDGTVAARMVNAGDLASPGSPLVEIHGSGKFEIEATIPESAGANLKLDDPLEVTAAETTFSGKVSEISSAADARARSITIKVAVPAGVNIHAGQFARLRIPTASRPGILVPASAITLAGQMERAFVVDDHNRVSLRLVRTLARHGDRVEIAAGLSAGDRVVIDPPPDLRDGQRVDARP